MVDFKLNKKVNAGQEEIEDFVVEAGEEKHTFGLKISNISLARSKKFLMKHSVEEIAESPNLLIDLLDILTVDSEKVYDFILSVGDENRKAFLDVLAGKYAKAITKFQNTQRYGVSTTDLN